MLSRFQMLTVVLTTLISFSFSQDVILSIDGTGLNYESTSDIYGFQFMLASRLDRDSDNWSVLFDFAGFFGRENYLPK